MTLSSISGERNAQYKKLKKREEEIDEFMNSFEENKTSEAKKLSATERNIQNILESMSR